MTRPTKFLSSLFVLGALAVSLHSQAAAAPIGTAVAPNVIDLGTLVDPYFEETYVRKFTAPTTETFYDNFTFHLNTGASLSSMTSSLKSSYFGIDNISARLYQGSGPFNALSTPLIQAWSAPVSGFGANGSLTMFSLPELLAGTYTMQIRGDVVGAKGGTYTSVLNVVAAIPEPETYGMLLTGLALIALVARRKSQAAK